MTIRRIAGTGPTSSALRSRTFLASPTKRTGRYRARVVFPTAGTWRYEVFDGFTEHGGARTHRFPPVRIAPQDT